MGVCDILENKGKYQKAADLIYYCVTGDSNNEELRHRWDRLIDKTNDARRGAPEISHANNWRQYTMV